MIGCGGWFLSCNLAPTRSGMSASSLTTDAVHAIFGALCAAFGIATVKLRGGVRENIANVWGLLAVLPDNA